jgi:hypothetical protein
MSSVRAVKRRVVVTGTGTGTVTSLGGGGDV